jgi:two-component system, NarL family, nitrate/nitrite response regulator NarL
LAHNDPSVSLPSPSSTEGEAEATPNHTATILVGRNALLRECLAHLLATSNYYVVASELAIANIKPTSLPVGRPVLLIVDAGCDIEVAVQQITCFRSQCPPGRIVVLTDVDHSDNLALFRSGAHAICRNDTTAEAFVKILDKVMQDGPAGALPVPPAEHRASFNEALPKPLLRRAPRLFEQDLMILRCLAQGQSNSDIAMHTGICLATAKLRVKAILRKIGARNRTQAAVWALRQDMFH